MDIVEARLKDLQAIEALVRAAWREEHATSNDLYLGTERVDTKLQSLREEFDGVGARLLVAYEGPRATGLVLAREQQGRVWVEELIFLPTKEGRGAALELLGAVAPADAEVMCEIARGNETLRKLLEERGFAKAAEVVLFRRPGQAAAK